MARNLLPGADDAPPQKSDPQKLHGKEDSSLQHSSLPNNPFGLTTPSVQGSLSLQ